MTNDIPQRFQSVLTKKNNESKLSIGLLDTRFINEPLINDLDLNNNKITNLKDAEAEFDAINKLQLDYQVKSLEEKLATAIREKERQFFEKFVLVDNSIETMTQTLMKINNLLIKKEAQEKPFYIHTFEINESPTVDIIRVMPYMRNFNYAIIRILILGYRKYKNGIIDFTKKLYFDINSAWSHLQLLNSNATLHFYEILKNEKDSELGLFMFRINNKPTTFGTTIKVIYSRSS